MHRKTRERDFTRIVSDDADELSGILSRQMAEVRVRPLNHRRDIRFQTTVYYFDFFFDSLLPTGAILDTIEGSGLDLYCLYLGLSGSLELREGSRRTRSTSDSACLGDLTLCSRKTFSEQSELLAIGVGRTEMAAHLADLIERPVQGPLDFAPSVSLTAGVGPAISALAIALRAGLANDAPLLKSPIAMKRLKDTMIALLLENVPHRFSADLRRPMGSASPYYVKRAIEFMWANASRPLSAAEIAAECGVGVRALNSGFQSFKHMPPMTYLREIRLTGVRQDLQDSVTIASVTDIALKWGFTHLGRFSAQYQSRFGELPSKTLRQGARRR
ncbi:MAG: AraC family transcriptional regulator [Phenylobacterium sp.]|uniref:AraC family transcriptional regulator n=1 Tax=Phenylobacterium sp. TaxID=1871053 RepID=UPI002733422C|nr:AraC family transcriptional regulator [Phenylobacterium sp.]MDP3746806.1 AraC family transcriptional regulator [Phenylobacterium sp.]